MDYYEGVVFEYLRADRATFVNTQCCIQLKEGLNPDVNGPHWYCDAVAVEFRSGPRILLCEISYSAQLSSLLKRLRTWNEHWDALCAALVRESNLPRDWPVKPWIFVPEALVTALVKRLGQITGSVESLAFGAPRVTPLEMAQPWRYRSWDRVGEAPKPDTIPKVMQV
jgi:hypothetical protein